MPTEGWALHLHGAKFDLDDLREALCPPFDPWVEDYEEEGEPALLLRSKSWTGLGSAREVMDDATGLIDLINGSALLNDADAQPVTLGSILKFNPDGSKDRVVIAASLNIALGAARARCSATVVGAAPLPPTESPTQRRIARATQNERVSDALAFLVRADNWFDLFKAMESIEAFSGGEDAMKKKFNGWERARRVANHARHAPAKQHPLPHNPPTFAEAKKIVLSAASTLI